MEGMMMVEEIIEVMESEEKGRKEVGIMEEIVVGEIIGWMMQIQVKRIGKDIIMKGIEIKIEEEEEKKIGIYIEKGEKGMQGEIKRGEMKRIEVNLIGNINVMKFEEIMEVKEVRILMMRKRLGMNMREKGVDKKQEREEGIKKGRVKMMEIII